MPVHFHTFLKLSKIEKSLFIQAYYFCIVFSLYLTFVHQKKAFKRLGIRGVESPFDLTMGVEEKVKMVEKSTRRAIRFIPWKVKCFARAIAAKRLLQMRGIPSTIYLGVAKEGNSKMIAHAWLRCGSVIVTGKEEMQRFTMVTFFS
jgi:hypothetical protein